VEALLTPRESIVAPRGARVEFRASLVTPRESLATTTASLGVPTGAIVSLSDNRACSSEDIEPNREHERELELERVAK